MNTIKAQLVNNLFDALHACNMADVPSDDDNCNDLPCSAIYQDNAYGHICEAIKALGYEAEYNEYIESGDRPVIV